MTIQLKKAIIIFLFLFSIILILLFQNYSLKGEFYNVLLISDQEDITIPTLTKTVFNSAKDLNNSTDITSYFTSVNTTYLQISDDKDLTSKLNDQIDANDMFIIVGDMYNESLRNIVATHLDKKFVLVENSLDYSTENVYKINFDWYNITSQVSQYLENEITDLKASKKLGENEKLDVVFLLDGEITDVKPTAFKKALKDLDVEVHYLDVNTNNYQQSMSKLYNEDKISYYVNLNFSGEEDIIKQLVDLQKDNVYTYYKQQTAEEAKTNTDETESETTEETNQEDGESPVEEKIELVPINYISVYNGDISLGEYDDITQGENTVENIIVNTFEYNLTDILQEIILQEKYKSETLISTKEENLNIQAIN